MKLLAKLLPVLFLTGCAGIMPDVAQIVHDVEDSAIIVEVNRDAIKQDTDIEIDVRVINKDAPKPKAI